MKRILLLVSLAGILVAQSTTALADTLKLKAEYPDPYIVKKGDTLWDISALFLNTPWLWPKLWGVNPHIANPHLIYPGDPLTLVFIDGEPRLVTKPHIHKKPQGRIQAKNSAIPVIDLALIQPYLTQYLVVAKDWLLQQPVLLVGERLSRHYVKGDIVYVQEALPLGKKLGFYSEGRSFQRNTTNEELGQELILASVGQVVESGKVSTIKLLTSYRETKAGDRIIEFDKTDFFPAYFMPQATQASEKAEILASGIGMNEMGKFDVAYIDRGAIDDVAVGDVFAIFSDGKKLTNASGLFASHSIELPKIFHGHLMVFKTFEKTSLALIMDNDRPVRVQDKLETSTQGD